MKRPCVSFCFYRTVKGGVGVINNEAGVKASVTSMSHKSNMADVNNSRGKETANASPIKEKKLYLTTVEAMAEVDKLKERVRSLSFCSSVSGESSDSGSSGTRPLARKQDDLVTCLSVMRRLMEQAESESKRMQIGRASCRERV